MAMTRMEQKQASSRRMLEAALSVFGEKGYSGTKISDIAKKADVAAGLVSQRFGTKEELYCAVLRDVLSRYRESTDRGSLADILLRLAELMHQGAEKQSDEFHFLTNHFSSTDVPCCSEHVLEEEFENSSLSSLMAEAIENGTIMKGKPYAVFSNFLRSGFFTCRNCAGSGVELPSSADLLRIVRFRFEEENRKLYLAGKNAVQEDDTRSRSIISSLSSDYDFVCYIDGKHNTVSNFRIVPQLAKIYENTDPELSSSHRFDAFLYAIVHPDDMDELLANVERTRVLNYLDYEQAYICRFRVVLDGDVLHYALKLVRDYADPDGFILGLKNVEGEYQEKSRDERRSQVLSILSSKYSGVFYVDTTTGKYDIFALDNLLSEDLGKHLRGIFNFADAYTWLVTSCVHPDDQDDMLDFLKTGLARLSYCRNVDYHFRRNYNGDYRYTEMNVIKVGKEMEAPTAVVVGFAEMDEELRLHKEQETVLREGIDVLYGIPDAKTALTELMRLLCSFHESDCAYIFEMNRDRSRIRMSYEWVRDGLEPIVENVESEPVEERRFWLRAFESKGALVVNNVEEEVSPLDPAYSKLTDEEVENLMCVPLISDGKITGFIGVDNAEYAMGDLLVLKSIAALVSSELLRRQQTVEEHILLNKITGNYTSIYFADLSSDYIHNYVITDEFRQRCEGLTSYDQYIEDTIANDVCEEDVARFRRMTSRDYIKEQFRTKESFAINFIMESSGRQRSFEILLIKANEEGSKVVICSRDNTSVVESEKRQQQAQRARLEELVTERTQELQEKNKTLNRVNEDITELLGNITEARDADSGRHIRRVKIFTHILAEQVMKDWPQYNLNKEQVALITSASALHDVGKIMIPDSILLKPARLSPEEFESMKTHCAKGCEILKGAPMDWSADYLKTSMDIAHYHHEKYDGSGYPEGLVGDDIPIAAQIVAIADCFEALTSKRVYKDAISPEMAIRMIRRGDCGVFSDKLLQSFKNCEALFLGNMENAEMVFAPAKSAIGGGTGLSGTRILFAEDNDLSRSICTEILEDEGVIVTGVVNGREAVKLFKSSAVSTFDAILMDINMPEMNGIEATIAIRESGRANSRTIPIIAVTSSEDQKDVDACMKAGMNDYINKPVSVSSITRALLTCLRSQSDVLLEQLSRTISMANKDPLTSVRNMTAYTSMVEVLTESIKANPMEIRFALVECDINNLKEVNDSCGHTMGDIYIKNCCSLICNVFKHSPVFRTGGDEFVAILKNDDYERRDGLMDELRRRVSESEGIEDVKKGRASLAAGIAVFDPELDDNVSTVFRRADGAMYSNKRQMKAARGAAVR